MSVDTNETDFRFSEVFDSLSLNDLYGEDLAMAMEVFGGSAVRISETLKAARAYIDAGDRDRLLREIHRIRPVFGYTGQPLLQDAVGRFEGLCRSGAAMSQVTEEFEELGRAMRESIRLIEGEHARLTGFINRFA